MLRRAPHLLKKIKNVREHNFEGGGNNSQLNEDTDRSNLNSKVKYLKLSSSVKYPVVGRGQHFQDRGHSFSPYGPTLSR